jgi:hypothetical protein
VLPLHDRERANMPNSQLVFLNHVVEPCWEALAKVVPLAAGRALAQARVNRGHWEALLEEVQSQGGSGGASRASTKEEV